MTIPPRRRLFLAAILVTGCTATAAAERPGPRIQMLQRWLDAVEHHEPGTFDDASKMVVSS
jgi:hypothetical protein